MSAGAFSIFPTGKIPTVVITKREISDFPIAFRYKPYRDGIDFLFECQIIISKGDEDALIEHSWYFALVPPASLNDKNVTSGMFASMISETLTSSSKLLIEYGINQMYEFAQILEWVKRIQE